MSALSGPTQMSILLLLFVFGLFARRRGWLKPSHAGRLMQLVINAGLPALFLADVSRISLRADLVSLPISAMLIIVALLPLSVVLGRALGLARQDQGAMTLCSMSLNIAFLFPFVIAAWGSTGFGQIAMFDFGNSLMQGSVVYAIAAIYGGQSIGLLPILRRVMSFPPLWALIIALLINVSGLRLYPWVTTGLSTAGRLILMLVFVALGILFDATMLRSRAVHASLLLRILMGLALGIFCAWLFHLEGMMRAVVLLGSAAPIGFSAVVMASRESLNRDQAASAASISVLLALVYVPLAIWLLPV
jgi:malate permease and related proteins